jgi:hypothetical protein
VSNFFICDFGRNEFYKAHMKPCKSQKALYCKNYLLASSIATATATCHVKQPAVVSTMGLLPALIRPISRFDVSVNDVAKEFAEKLHTQREPVRKIYSRSINQNIKTVPPTKKRAAKGERAKVIFSNFYLSKTSQDA